MNRRSVLTGAAAVGLASVSGCLGLVGLDEHESKPAGVEQSVLDDAGYDQTGVEVVGVEEEVDALLYSESVRVKNYLTEHEKAVDMGPLGTQRGAVFMLLTTPQVEIAGRELNPVEEMSTEELVELVEDSYDDISNIEREADNEVTLLGQTTTVSRFGADARFDGAEVDVLLYVTEAVRTREDLLVAISVYPERLRAEEEENVVALMEGVIEDAHDA